MVALDPLIHAPARLRLMAALSVVSEAEFATLREHLGVSDSVLSKHLAALAEAGYVTTRKSTHRGRRTTWVALTGVGRRALTRHAAALRELLDAIPER
jgi:DNA-binding MarR family transcriptional regulator